MNDLLDGLETVRVYIDDILHVTKGTWEDRLKGLEEVFKRLQNRQDLKSTPRNPILVLTKWNT
jgi:hypothetical protein